MTHDAVATVGHKLPDIAEDMDGSLEVNLLQAIDELQNVLVDEEMARRDAARDLEAEENAVQEQMEQLKLAADRLRQADDELGYLQSQLEEQMYRKATLVEALRTQKQEARALAQDLDELEPQLMVASLTAADLLMEVEQLRSERRAIQPTPTSSWSLRRWGAAPQPQKVV